MQDTMLFGLSGSEGSPQSPPAPGEEAPERLPGRMRRGAGTPGPPRRFSRARGLPASLENPGNSWGGEADSDHNYYSPASAGYSLSAGSCSRARPSGPRPHGHDSRLGQPPALERISRGRPYNDPGAGSVLLGAAPPQGDGTGRAGMRSPSFFHPILPRPLPSTLPAPRSERPRADLQPHRPAAEPRVLRAAPGGLRAASSAAPSPPQLLFLSAQALRAALRAAALSQTGSPRRGQG